MPQEVFSASKRIRDLLAHEGFVVRTAMMTELDRCFADTKDKEMIIPFRGWKVGEDVIESKFSFVSEEAKELAKIHAPHWDKITKDVVKTFLAKNIRLIAGQNMKGPARFGIIYSVDGAELPSECGRDTGNMRHVIESSRAMFVPVFNLARPNVVERVFQHLGLAIPA